MGAKKKVLIFIGVSLAACVGLLVLYLTPAKLPYYAFEETAPGLMTRVPAPRVPQALDRVEAVLKQDKIPYRRVNARTLYFDVSTDLGKLIEIERRAGLRKS